MKPHRKVPIVSPPTLSAPPSPMTPNHWDVRHAPRTPGWTPCTVARTSVHNATAAAPDNKTSTSD